MGEPLKITGERHSIVLAPIITASRCNNDKSVGRNPFKELIVRDEKDGAAAAVPVGKADEREVSRAVTRPRFWVEHFHMRVRPVERVESNVAM